MSIELTNEQIVTKLLISNEILKPKKQYTEVSQASNLGDFLHKMPKTPLMLNSKYAFIDLENGWKF